MAEASILELQKVSDRAYMFMSCLLSVLPGFGSGATLGYLTLSLSHYLEAEITSGIVMSEEQASWFVSLNSPMQMVGLMLSSWLTDKFGRKPTIIGSSILMMMGAIVLFVASSFYFLLLGVAIAGLASGIVEPPVYLLLSEISLIRYRGTLMSMNTMTDNGGYLYGLIVGNMVPFHFLPFVSITPLVLFLCLSWWLVESPLWHAKKGRSDMSKKTLEWLRGPNYIIDAELKELENLNSERSTTSVSLLISRKFLIPLSITFLCFGTQILTLIDILCFYMLPIVDKASLPISGVAMAVIFQTCTTVAYMINPFLMAKFKRRPLFLTSAIAIALSLLTLGSLFYIGSDSLFHKIGSIICLLVIATSYGLGVGPITFCLTGELFPQELRSFGCSLAISSRLIFLFVDTKMFSLMESILGMYGVFFLHGGFLSALLALAFFFLPETKDLSLTELQQLYCKDQVQEQN